MTSPTNMLSDLQNEFRALHANYGKMPKWEFMLKSVQLVDKMELIEEIIKGIGKNTDK